MNQKVLSITRAAIIAALYVILTFLSNALGLASGLVQVRISEALAVMCVFTPAGVYGITIGCLLSNIFTGCLLPDVIFGTLATLIGAVGTRIVGTKAAGIGAVGTRIVGTKAAGHRSMYLALLPTVISNSLIIPLVLYYVYGFRPLWLCFLTVFAGEVISCYVFGIPLYLLINKNKRALGLY